MVAHAARSAVDGIGHVPSGRLSTSRSTSQARSERRPRSLGASSDRLVGLTSASSAAPAGDVVTPSSRRGSTAVRARRRAAWIRSPLPRRTGYLMAHAFESGELRMKHATARATPPRSPDATFPKYSSWAVRQEMMLLRVAHRLGATSGRSWPGFRPSTSVVRRFPDGRQRLASGAQLTFHCRPDADIGLSRKRSLDLALRWTAWGRQPGIGMPCSNSARPIGTLPGFTQIAFTAY